MGAREAVRRDADAPSHLELSPDSAQGQTAPRLGIARPVAARPRAACVGPPSLGSSRALAPPAKQGGSTKTRLYAVANLDSVLSKKHGSDCLVVVAHDYAAADHKLVVQAFAAARALDAKAASGLSLLSVAGAPGGRAVLAPTGPVLRDHDDVRRYAEAARKGLLRARDAGSVELLVVLVSPRADQRHLRAARVAALGAIGGLWEPLEALGASVEPVAAIGFAVPGGGFCIAQLLRSRSAGKTRSSSRASA